MGFSKKQWSWLLYDPANAAFALIARTVFFPVFFMAVAKPVWGEAVSTAYLSCTASAAGIAAGVYPDYETAAERVVRVTKTVVPRPEYAKIYAEKYEAYRAVNDALAGVWDKLR